MSRQGPDAQRLNDLVDRLHELADADTDTQDLPDDTDWRTAIKVAREIVDIFTLRVGFDAGDGSTVIGMTLEGLDIYVNRTSDGSRLSVSVGTDELPAEVAAVVEANDGVSWEQPLP